MKMLLIFDAYHDFGDVKRTKSSVPADVYRRKLVPGFPGTHGPPWTTFEIMVGFGLNAISDVEGELTAILTQKCPKMFTDVVVLSNTKNEYITQTSGDINLAALPVQFDIEKSNPLFPVIINKIRTLLGFAEGTPYYYADAGPGIGEKIGQTNGCDTPATKNDSASASDGLTGVCPQREHVFGLKNLPFPGDTKITFTPTAGNTTPLPFTYKLDYGGHSVTDTLQASINSGPSLPYLSLVIRDQFLKDILKRGGPKNALERTYIAKETFPDPREFRPNNIISFLTEKRWTDQFLDNFCFNEKTSADYEQPRAADSLGLRIGGTLDGEEAKQIILNGHISLYKHTVDGKSTVTIYNIPIAGDPIERKNRAAVSDYISAVKDFNFYVKCCNQFALLTNPEYKKAQIENIEGQFNNFVQRTDRTSIQGLLAIYCVRVFVVQLIEDIQNISEIAAIPFEKELLPEVLPAEELADSAHIRSKTEEFRNRINSLSLLPDFLSATKVLDNNHISPIDKLNAFILQTSVEYGTPAADVPYEDIRLKITELQSLNGKRVLTSIKTTIDAILINSVLTGLFSKVSKKLPVVLQEIGNVKKMANAAAENAPVNPGTAAYETIIASLRALALPPPAAAAAAAAAASMGGGRLEDIEATFTRLYEELAEADDLVNVEYMKLPDDPDKAAQLGDEEYDAMMEPYKLAQYRVEMKLLDIELENYKIDQETSRMLYDRDINQIKLLMRAVADLHDYLKGIQAPPAAAAGPGSDMDSGDVGSAAAAAPAAMATDGAAAPPHYLFNPGPSELTFGTPPVPVSGKISAVVDPAASKRRIELTAETPAKRPAVEEGIETPAPRTTEELDRMRRLQRRQGQEKMQKAAYLSEELSKVTPEYKERVSLFLKDTGFETGPRSFRYFVKEYAKPGKNTIPLEEISKILKDDRFFKYNRDNMTYSRRFKLRGGTLKRVCSSCGHRQETARRWKTQRKPRRRDDEHRVEVEIVAL